MHRRNFLILCGIGGLGLALGNQYLSAQPSSTSVSCPTEAKKRRQQSLLHFVALGDTGTGGEGQYAVANAMNCYQQANPFSLVLLTGDNIYNRGEIQKIGTVFEQPYRALLAQKIPFYATLGNHDVVINNGEDEIKYANFNMKGRYYTFTKEPVQFFVLDTNKNHHCSLNSIGWKII